MTMDDGDYTDGQAQPPTIDQGGGSPRTPTRSCRSCARTRDPVWSPRGRRLCCCNHGPGWEGRTRQEDSGRSDGSVRPTHPHSSTKPQPSTSQPTAPAPTRPKPPAAQIDAVGGLPRCVDAALRGGTGAVQGLVDSLGGGTLSQLLGTNGG